MNTLVIIPTYNECLTLEHAVAGVCEHAPDVDVLVVDDNSPDGTGKIADRLAESDSRVHVMHRSEKSGLGDAYIAGFQWALDREYDLICEMDADGSHRAVDLPRLVQRAVADPQPALVIGSRWIPGGSVVNWPLRRQLLSRAGNVYIRILLGMPVADATAGFRVYPAATLRGIDLGTIASHGYCFQTDMTWRVVRGGGQVVEVPITFVERDTGQSKMSGAIVRESLLRVTQWGIAYRSTWLRRPLHKMAGWPHPWHRRPPAVLETKASEGAEGSERLI